MSEENIRDYLLQYRELDDEGRLIPIPFTKKQQQRTDAYISDKAKKLDALGASQMAKYLRETIE